VALRRRSVPAWLRRLGTISYSVYLVQALVLLAVPALPSALLTAAVWTALVIGLSEVTYRLVEQPAVRLGRRLVTGKPAVRSRTVRMPSPRSPDRKPTRTTTAPRRLAV
jgi:peptidoglycan/LPS O-acetylase OafA/YrhL